MTARLDGIAVPGARLEARGKYALAADKSLLAALQAAADHPVVGPALQRVTATRVAYLAALFRAAGIPAADARRRALLLYSADVGMFTVRRALGSGPPPGRELGSLVEAMTAAFLPNQPCLLSVPAPAS